MSAADRDRLEAFLRRSTALGFHPATAPTLSTICSEGDNQLFTAIISSSSHLLHHLSPPKHDTHYSLRPSAQDFTFSILTTTLRDNNYLNRMLYKNIGCIWSNCNIYFNLPSILCISGLTQIDCRCIKLSPTWLTYLLTCYKIIPSRTNWYQHNTEARRNTVSRRKLRCAGNSHEGNNNGFYRIAQNLRS